MYFWVSKSEKPKLLPDMNIYSVKVHFVVCVQIWSHDTF